MPRIILTRPPADSQSLAAALAEYGIDCVLSPAMEIRPLPVTLPDAAGLDGLIATSRHALPACLPLKRLPLYAVGDHTASFARNLGFIVAAQAETAETLFPLIPAQKHYLYASGETVRLDFTQHLPHACRVIAYRAEASNELPSDVINTLSADTADGVVFYSPRAAEIFTKLLNNNKLSEKCRSLTAFCLSEAIALCCAKRGWRHIRVAASPTQTAMISLLANMK